MSTKTNMFLVTVILFSSSLVTFAANAGTGEGTAEDPLLVSTVIVPSIAHGKINIVGNTQLAAFFAGNTSDGTSGKPYVIQGFEINAGGTGSAIYIEDTDKHLIIQSCNVQGSGNTVGSAGIRLNNCTNVIVRWNTLANNAYHGIHVEAGSHDVMIEGNAITSNARIGISLYDVRDVMVSQNTITGASNLTSIGINVETATNVTVQLNNMSSPMAYGIWFTGGVYQGRITGNRITNCSYTGISITESSMVVVDNNIVTRCSYHGLEIFNDCCDSNITHNLVTYCGFAGIRFYNGNDNITGNKIWYNAFVHNRDGESLTRWMVPTENDWDVGGIGNYWGDYRERYPAATQSGNVWNTPYAINETTYAADHDYFPLVSIDLITGQGPGPTGTPLIEAALWIILIAFLAAAALVVFKAHQLGVLLPRSYK
ncbi:MAG: nitrous oxide reductase family maturation protein NosD [Candidatus Sigynarchaeota archaeon]